MGRDAQARLTGEGWSPVDWDDAGPFRWLTATQGRVVLPLAGRTPRRLQLQVLRDPRSLASSIRIRLNGADLPAQPLQDGWHVYDWVLSPGQAAAGTNEVSVLVDRVADAPAGRAGGKGIAVSDVRVIHDES